MFWTCMKEGGMENPIFILKQYNYFWAWKLPKQDKSKYAPLSNFIRHNEDNIIWALSPFYYSFSYMSLIWYDSLDHCDKSNSYHYMYVKLSLGY